MAATPVRSSPRVLNMNTPLAIEPPATLLGETEALETYKFINLLHSEFGRIDQGKPGALNGVQKRIAPMLLLSIQLLALQVNTIIVERYPNLNQAEYKPKVNAGLDDLVRIKHNLRMRFKLWTEPRPSQAEVPAINNNDAVCQKIAQNKRAGDTAQTLWWLRLAISNCDAVYRVMQKWSSSGSVSRPPTFMLFVGSHPVKSLEYVHTIHILVQRYIGAGALQSLLLETGYPLQPRITKLAALLEEVSEDAKAGK